MHVPDGFLDAPTSIATGGVAVAAVAVSLRRAAPEIRRTGVALPGLVAAFVFAVQMVNFPVGAGTSGHLLGGVLAAALVGPWTAVLCLTVVLAIQALLFADGGLTALGTNVTLMAVVAVLVGYPLTRLLLTAAGRRRAAIPPAAGLAAAVSVPAAAAVFTALYAVGGTVSVPIGAVAGAMIGWHTVIGIGEGLITAAVLTAVLARRPDLVHLARGSRGGTALLRADGRARDDAAPERSAPPDGPVPRGDATPAGVGRPFFGTALTVGLLVAGGLSALASSHPDGLEFVGERFGFSSRDSWTAGGPLADYTVAGWSQAFVAGAVAGIVGVLATLVLGLLVARAARRSKASGRATDAGPVGEAADSSPAGVESRRGARAGSADR